MKYIVPLEITFYGSVVVDANDECDAMSLVDDAFENNEFIERLDGKYLIDSPSTDGWEVVDGGTEKADDEQDLSVFISATEYLA